jgi:hypothetical protein
MEDKWSIRKVVESQGDMHKKVANQSNSELSSLSPTQSPGPSHTQIDVKLDPLRPAVPNDLRTFYICMES